MKRREIYSSKALCLNGVEEEFFKKNKLFFGIDNPVFLSELSRSNELQKSEEDARSRLCLACGENLNSAIAYKYIKDPQLHSKDLEYLEAKCEYQKQLNEYHKYAYALVGELTIKREDHIQPCYNCKYKNLLSRMEIPECFECKAYLGNASQSENYIIAKSQLFNRYKRMRLIQEKILRKRDNIAWLVGIFSN